MRESTAKTKWEKFKMNEVQVRAHLAGLSCVMDEVIIISSEHSFCVYAFANDMTPVVQFFNEFHVDKNLEFYNTTSDTMELLLASVLTLDHGGLTVNPSNTIEQSYRIAKEAGSIGVVLDQLFRSLIKDNKQVRYTGIDPSFLNVKTFNNGYFYCQS